MNWFSLIPGAKRLIEICGKVKNGEQALVITDYNKLNIAYALVSILYQKNNDPVLIIMPPRSRHGQEPPKPVVEASAMANVVFAPTTFSLTHTSARVRNIESGGKFISMPDYGDEMLIQGGLFADFYKQQPTLDRLAELLTSAKTANIRAHAGTNITMNIEGRIGRAERGICIGSGTYACPPNMECNISPNEDSAEGVAVIDGSIPDPLIGLIKEPIHLDISKGKIINIKGGSNAEKLRGLLSRLEDPAAYVLAELGIGLNPQGTLCGRMLEDESVFSTIHFGFGDNCKAGGVNKSKIHLDMVILNAELELDGKKVLQNGRMYLD